VSFAKKDPTPDRNVHSLSQEHILLIIKINALALYFQNKGKGVSLFGLDLKLINVRYRVKIFEAWRRLLWVNYRSKPHFKLIGSSPLDSRLWTVRLSITYCVTTEVIEFSSVLSM
jgi:hypothetical protein